MSDRPGRGERAALIQARIAQLEDLLLREAFSDEELERIIAAIGAGLLDELMDDADPLRDLR